APWRVYAEHLLPYGYGYPLWHSSTPNGGAILRGDVGFIDQGTFVPLFNALHRGEDTSNCGVPEGYKTLEEMFPGRQILKVTTDACMPSQVFISPGIEYKYPLISLTCKRDSGAVLVMKEPPAERQAISSILFVTDYMRKYYNSWCEFAVARGVSIPEEGLIFVYGVFGTDARGAVAFANCPNNSDLEITWNLGDGLFKATMNGREMEEGSTVATPMNLVSMVPRKHDQALFIQYYKMKRRLFWLRMIRAGAGPHDLPGSQDGTGGDDV
ncbi:hypothetical protein C8Q80DRAFT_1073724, partial [Daedaleopsis nitida]